jgi:hypothetical protein
MLASWETDPPSAHLHSHTVDVDLLVEVVEQSNGLDNHGIYSVGGKLELEPERGGKRA